MSRQNRNLTVDDVASLDFRPVFCTAGVFSSNLELVVKTPGGSVLNVAKTDTHVTITSGDPAVPPTRLQLVYLRPGFGGRRPMIECPGCKRRCLVMYLVNAAWRCRVCHRLSHASQRMPPLRRAARKILNLRALLGDDGPIWGVVPVRPKAMKWTKYQRLLEQLAEATAAHTELMKAKRASRKNSGAQVCQDQPSS